MDEGVRALVPARGRTSATPDGALWVNEVGMRLERISAAAERDTAAVLQLPWCDVNTVEWDGQRLVVQPLDPASEVLRLELDPEPDWDFMELIRQSLTHAVVVTNSEQLENGTIVAASVRRGVDGHLFSVVVAYGSVPAELAGNVADLEARVRESVGLPTR